MKLHLRYLNVIGLTTYRNNLFPISRDYINLKYCLYNFFEYLKFIEYLR